jgi:ABC-type multidrug transport system ATPase subunit
LPDGHAGQESSILTIRGLSRSFGSRHVVRALDLSVEAGERVALRGPNGSGKTTVLRCAAGTLTPTSGEVRIAGWPAGTRPASRLVGASLSQERSFYLRLTGWSNLLFFARLRHESRQKAAAQVRTLEEELEISDITARRLDTCSTGMLQQVGFARALLGDPALLLLDEPTRSLDSEAIGRLWAALDRRRHIAVLTASHREDDIARCDSHVDLPS